MNIYEVMIRLLLATVVGGLIGYEREYKNRPAGFRTHILVCVGAAVISMIQLYNIDETVNIILKHPELANALKADIGRIGAQVVSGIGFLGAGTIIHQKGSVKGLTTAASLWAVACIGLAIGLGYYPLSILSTVVVVLVLVSLKKFESKFMDRYTLIKVEIVYLDIRGMVENLDNYFRSKDIKVKSIEFVIDEETADCKASYPRSLYYILMPRYMQKEEIIRDIALMDGIVKVNVT